MKRAMRKVRVFVSHLMISMLLVLAVLVVLDEYNPAMGFLNSNVAKIFYAVLCAVGLFTAVCLAWQDS